MHSGIFEGRVIHERRIPIHHQFRYRLFMMGLDLDELDEVFRSSWLWSTRRPSVAWFRRKDHFGDPDVPLDTSVRELVAERLGFRPEGRILLLTHLRYFGFVINPISIYVCFRPDTQTPEVAVLEVTNTPWGERCLYVIDLRNGDERVTTRKGRFRKTMHVSPFMEMDYDYAWSLRWSSRGLSFRLANEGEAGKPFAATLSLSRKPVTRGKLRRLLLAYPLMTLQVLAGIYIEAARLALKGAPFHSHPKHEALGEEAHEL